ncbi:hypothetical protein GCM10022600_18300 [Qipengyuania pelagi]|jgi:hypothetical protein|uniref:Entry exclusion lipoprotein TrbK n=1 Tax=Qipengyuania pelagi TaxID=994320 RepID=A0A844Y8G1_9SPHN|nr:hypothetical protein [Qipengyuania pelagi]MXO53318.1 hypothetical protein [Qipengyuania pelagi]
MFRSALSLTTLFGVVLALSSCETTNEDEWTGGGRKPFHQAEQTCEAQAGRLTEEKARPAFFTDCMRTFGWTRRSGAA